MKVSVENIGGISQLTIDFQKGVTLYKAPNAFGKTSLMRAIVSLLTSELKGEDLLNVAADRGKVEVFPSSRESYYRVIERKGMRVVETKKLWMDDRRALLLSYFSPENRIVNYIVSGDANVEWFLSETSKLEEIKSKKIELESLLAQRRQQLSELKNVYGEASSLQSKIREVEEEIRKVEEEKKNSELAIKAKVSVTVTKSNKLNDLKIRIDKKREELSEIRQSLKRLREKLSDLKARADDERKRQIQDEISRINGIIEEKTKRKSEIEIELKLLERVRDDIREAERSHVSTCYLCGTQVDPSHWSTRLDIIGTQLRERQRSLESIRAEIEALVQERKNQEELLGEFSRIESEITSLQSKISDLEFRDRMVEDELQTLERQLREFSPSPAFSLAVVDDVSSHLDQRLENLRKELSRLQTELQQTGMPSSISSKMRDLEDEVKNIESQLDAVQRDYLDRLTRVREVFNSEALKLTRMLGFNFEAHIDDKNIISVRKGNIELDLKKLSSSERTTLALLLVITALKTYFKTPIFIVDEVFMTFDQQRLMKILNYLMGLAEYVVVTRSDESNEVTQVSTVSRAEAYTFS